MPCSYSIQIAVVDNIGLQVVHICMKDTGSNSLLIFFLTVVDYSPFLMDYGPLQISFQEFRNNLLVPGLVDHIVVANKLVAKVYVRNNPLDQAMQGRGSRANASQYKYYFNIGSVDLFEEKLQEAQEYLGIDPHDHVPVIYRSELGLILTLLATTVALLILGTMYLMRKISSGLGVGGKDVRGLFSMKKAHIIKADKNAKNKVSLPSAHAK